jgi:hypothetical protein
MHTVSCMICLMFLVCLIISFDIALVLIASSDKTHVMIESYENICKTNNQHVNDIVHIPENIVFTKTFGTKSDNIFFMCPKNEHIKKMRFEAHAYRDTIASVEVWCSGNDPPKKCPSPNKTWRTSSIDGTNKWHSVDFTKPIHMAINDKYTRYCKFAPTNDSSLKTLNLSDMTFNSEQLVYPEGGKHEFIGFAMSKDDLVEGIRFATFRTEPQSQVPSTSPNVEKAVDAPPPALDVQTPDNIIQAGDIPTTSNRYEYVDCFSMDTMPLTKLDGTVVSLDECCNSAEDRNYKYFGVTDHNQCYIGESYASSSIPAPKSQCQFICSADSSTTDMLNVPQCGSKNTMSLYINKSYKAPPYKYVACIIDDNSKRALPQYMGTVNNVQDCYNKANDKNMKYFAIQNHNMCFASSNQSYKEYEEADQSECTYTCGTTSMRKTSSPLCGNYNINAVYEII